MLGQWGEDDCRVLLAGLHKYGPDFQLLALVLPYTEEEVCERGLPMVSHSGIRYKNSITYCGKPALPLTAQVFL